MDLATAIRRTRPGQPFHLPNAADLTTLAWHGEGDPPTLEELQAAWPECQAIIDRIIALKANREAMASLFDSMSVAQRAAFLTVRLAVERALDSGDVELAHYLITEQQVTPDLAELKAAILSHLPE